MSKLVESIINGTCPSCNVMLPPLEREGDFGGWAIVDCPTKKCNEWFDVQSYLKAGGKEI